jgi:SAM-dependent methyltransferase
MITPGTRAFYDAWAADGPEADRSAVSRQFEAAFAAGARVLDVGCGKGRDVVALLDMGFDAWGVEPNDAMRARALARDPRVAGRIAAAALPDLGQPFGGGFDAVVCCAVLMHVAPADLPGALEALVSVLRPAGRLLLALPEMRADLLAGGCDPDGRQFANHPPERVESLLAAQGLALLRCDEIATSSTDTRWRTLLFERQGRSAEGVTRHVSRDPDGGPPSASVPPHAP